VLAVAETLRNHPPVSQTAAAGSPASHASYARVIAPLLPAKAFRRSPRRLAYAAGQLTLFLAVAVSMRWIDSIVVRALAAVVAGHALLGLAFFAHELSHGAVIGEGPLRRVCELVAWGPNLVAPTVWRKVHNESHHRHANTPKDPDRRFMTQEERAVTRLYTRLFYPARGGLRLNPLILLHFVPYVVKHTLGALLPRGELSLLPCRVRFAPRERLAVAVELLVIAIIQGGLFELSGGQVGRYLFVGPIAVAWTSAFVMLYVFTNHFANPLSEHADALAGTTSVIVHPVIDRLHLHFSFHSEHHLFPAIDSSYFPLVSALLTEHFPLVYRRVPLHEAWRRAFEQPAFVEVDTRAQRATPLSAGVEPAALAGR
jgi:fatty acid desaturase